MRCAGISCDLLQVTVYCSECWSMTAMSRQYTSYWCTVLQQQCTGPRNVSSIDLRQDVTSRESYYPDITSLNANTFGIRSALLSEPADDSLASNDDKRLGIKETVFDTIQNQAAFVWICLSNAKTKQWQHYRTDGRTGAEWWVEFWARKKKRKNVPLSHAVIDVAVLPPVKIVITIVTTTNILREYSRIFLGYHKFFTGHAPSNEGSSVPGVVSYSWILSVTVYFCRTV